MPLLKYRCAACGKVFEELVSFSRAEEAVCPACGEKAQRAYEGKCLFGLSGSSAGRGGSGGCTGNCATCGGCSGHQH